MFASALPLPMPVGAMKRKMPTMKTPVVNALDTPLDLSIPNRSRARMVNSAGSCSSDTDSDGCKVSPGTNSYTGSAFTAPRDLSCFPPTPSTPSLAQLPLMFPGLTPFQQTMLMALAQRQQPLMPAIQLPVMSQAQQIQLPMPSTTTTAAKKAPKRKSTASVERSVKQSRPSAQVSPDSSSTTSEYIINPATGNKVRRNYKNMTCERRKEANARERSRVHIIGAAFDKVREILPAVQDDNKLSKLSILRIACKYIALLGAMKTEIGVEKAMAELHDTITNETRVAVPVVPVVPTRSRSKPAQVPTQVKVDLDESEEPINVST